MAAYGWGSRTSVADWLFAEGHRFDFYQAVKLLEMLRPECTPVGEGTDASREPVHFRGSSSLAFPASDVAEVRDGPRPELIANFMSLTGALGPLPHPFTERLLDRVCAGDTALRDFLDLFNHRLISLVHRLRRAHRLGLEWSSPEQHRFATYLYAFLGLETAGLRGRLRLPDRALLRYAGLIARKPHSTSVLCVILSDFFAVPVRARQFVGAFRAFDEDQWTAIGEAGRNHALGQGALLGTTLWDQHAGIALTLGPLSWPRYLDLLPGRPGAVALCQIVRFYLGPAFEITLRLLVRGEEVPPARLGVEGGPRLGQTSFLTLGRPLAGTLSVDIA
jgi:type VI secretion system protein ImpH